MQNRGKMQLSTCVFLLPPRHTVSRAHVLARCAAIPRSSGRLATIARISRRDRRFRARLNANLQQAMARARSSGAREASRVAGWRRAVSKDAFSPVLPGISTRAPHRHVCPPRYVMLGLSHIPLLTAIAPLAQTILGVQTLAGARAPVSRHSDTRTLAPRRVARMPGDQSFSQAPFFTPLFVASLASLSSLTAHLSDLDQPLHVCENVAARVRPAAPVPRPAMGFEHKNKCPTALF